MPALSPARLLLAGVAFAGVALCAELAARALALDGPNAPLLGALAAQGLWMGLAVGLAAVLADEGVGARLGLGPIQLRARTLLALVVGTVLLSQGLSLLLSALALREKGALAEIDAMILASEGSSFALALLALGLAPGIAEELLFRGLIQRGLVARIGVRAGIALAAVAFGVAHADLVHAPVAALLGAYLGVAGWLARSTRAPILCHVVNNTLGVLVPRLPLPRDSGVAAVAGVLLVAAAIAVLYRTVHAELRRTSAPAPVSEADPDPA